MRKWLMLSVLALAGTMLSTSKASAWGYGLVVHPYYTSAAFPCLNPPGYFTNVYYYAWYYPWYAYYNYSHGPYANWWHWGGYATYGGACGLYGCGQGQSGLTGPKPAQPATVCVNLPADAKLLFNGTAATGTGESRTFATPALTPGQEYEYTLTAEVVRDGRVLTATERVRVRAGSEAKIELTPRAATVAGR